jgi:anti-sigma factor RsiW
MIMECARCRENLTAYLDGELSPAEFAGVRSHLDACAICAGELGSLQEAADFIGSQIRELEPGPASWPRIRTRISDQNSRSPFRFLAFGRWRFAVATMVFMAALALSYFWHQQVQQRSLDEYISQYVKAREAGEHFRFLIGKVRSGIDAENFSAGNPFIEAKATMDINPFRSEDR